MRDGSGEPQLLAHDANLTRIDTLRYIDKREYDWEIAMIRFKRSKPTVEFCDSCSRVCNRGCRAASVRERAVMNAFRFGARV